MIDKDKVSKTIDPEKLGKDKVSKKASLEKDKEIKEKEYFKQPPSDSEDDICGPLNCDKEL